MVLLGILSQDAKRGWLLRLEGCFENLPPEAQPESKGPTTVGLTLPDDYPILLGITGEGRLVTLFGGQVLSGSLGLWTNAQLKVWPTILAYDVHFESIDDFTLTSLSLRYSNLDAWTAISGFAVDLSPSFYPVTVKYSLPEPIEVELSEGTSLRVEFAATGPSLPAQSELHIVQRAWVGVTSSKGCREDDLFRFVTRFSDLIALAVGQPLRPLEVAATCDARTESNSPLKRVSVELVHNREPIAPELPDVDVRDMLFSLADIRDRFADLARTWFAKYEEIKPLYDLYFGTLRSPKMYVEHRFLNMFQALESFDRRTRLQTSEKVSKHQERLGRILNAVSQDEDKKWLRGRLRHSHEPSASDRIRYLVEKVEAKWLLDDNAVELAATLRNFYTHFSPELELRLPPREERPRCMHNLAVRLQILCEMTLLEQIGFSCEEVKLKIEKTRRLERRLAH